MAELRHIDASDGYALAYRRWSPQGRPRATFVLLNGIMSNSAWFEPVAPRLAEAGFAVVGADRRGSGPNAQARGDAPSAGQLVDDVLAIVAAERIPDAPLHLLGWCWGAALAINAAAKLDLQGLVLVTPGIHNTPALEQSVTAQRELIERSAPDDPVIASPVREEWFTTGPQLEAFIRRDEQRVRTMTPRMLDVTRKLATGALVRLRKLDVPILLVLAEHDEATDNAATRAAFPHVQTVVLPARHGVQFDAPDALLHHLLTFAERPPGGHFRPRGRGAPTALPAGGGPARPSIQTKRTPMEFRSREAQQFIAGLSRPEEVQQRFLLQQVLQPNVGSEFGRRAGFDRIETIADYQRAVPIGNYDAFAPMIDRIVHRGEQGLLTTAPVKRFFLTSGSTAKSKYVPVTSAFVSAKSRAFGVYWSAVFEQHPRAKAGRMVTNFSDSGEAVASPGGLPCSSESAFWAGVTRATQLTRAPIIPKAVAQIGDSDSRYYAIARILLEETFSAIMTLNPSTILLLFQKVGQYADQLVADVERGGIDRDRDVGDVVRSYVQERYTGNPARADQLRALQAEGALLAHRIWPELAVGISWRSPMLRPYLDLLAPHFGDIPQRDYIMMASEGIMAIPMQDGRSGGPLAVGVHFYEFVPEDQIERPDPDVLLPHELEEGRTYVLILTNNAGLYRYDIGDVVRVTGFMERTPCIEFLHRAGSTCSLTGEKLTEDQVTAAMTDTAAALGVAVESFTLAPAKTGFPRYVALVEFERPPVREQLEAFARRLDEALEQRNMEYGSKRSSQRLAAPELWVVAPGGYDARRRQRLAGGTSDSQIKPTHLTRDSGFCDQFEILERFDAR